MQLLIFNYKSLKELTTVRRWLATTLAKSVTVTDVKTEAPSEVKTYVVNEITTTTAAIVVKDASTLDEQRLKYNSI